MISASNESVFHLLIIPLLSIKVKVNVINVNLQFEFVI